jgi:hypothetical protein
MKITDLLHETAKQTGGNFSAYVSSNASSVSKKKDNAANASL